MIRAILRYPDKRLKHPSLSISQFDNEVRAIITDMMDTMHSSGGIGLAAIQIGEPLRLFIVRADVVGKTLDSMPVVFINPEIVEARGAEFDAEGCLSFPGVSVPVRRNTWVHVRALDEHGKPFEVQTDGLYARVIQHEHDHVWGKVLADRVGAVTRDIIRRKMRRFKGPN